MTVDLAKLIERLERLAKIARRALSTNKTLSVWSADPETLELAAEALSRLSGERDESVKRIAELKQEKKGGFAFWRATAKRFADARKAALSQAETAERQHDEAIERAVQLEQRLADQRVISNYSREQALAAESRVKTLLAEREAKS